MNMKLRNRAAPLFLMALIYAMALYGLIFSTAVQAACAIEKNQSGTMITSLPLGVLVGTHNMRVGDFFEPPLEFSDEIYATCDSEGGISESQGYARHCFPLNDRCYLAVPGVPGLGMLITDAKERTYGANSYYDLLEPNKAVRSGKLTVQFVKISNQLQSGKVPSFNVFQRKVSGRAGVALRAREYQISGGRLINQPCYVSPQPAVVDLGFVPLTELAPVGPGKNFTINFSGCPTGSVHLMIKNTLSPDPTQGILPNLVPTNEGGAANVAIQVMSVRRQPVELNVLQDLKHEEGGEFTRDYFAQIRKLTENQPARAGKLKAMADLIVTYE